jgi:hypothetical protein
MGVLLALMVPMAGPILCATSVDHFAGGMSQVDIVLSAPGFNATTHIPVPYPSTPVGGALNVSTIPGAGPLGPRIDIGGDGSTEWEFNASYGPFGQQVLFADGMPNLTLPVAGPSDVDSKTTLPKDAEVISASMNMTCTPNDPQMAEGSKRNNIVGAFGALYENITGVPKNATGVNASVRIDGGKKTIVDQEQNDYSSMQVVGNMSTRQSLAQTFSPSVDGDLVEVQFYITNITDTPGTLSVEIRLADANGTPTSTRISTTMTAPQNSVYPGNWSVASFTDLQLMADMKYALVVYARSAMSGRDSYYGFGCNISDRYPRGALWAYPGSANASGPPSEIAGADMAFRALLKTNATTVEMGRLTVKGQPVVGPDSSGGYWCNFSDPVYTNGSWPLAIANPNDFDMLYLNWTARTWYRRNIENVTFDVGNDGTFEAAFEGILAGTTTVHLPPGALNAALQAASGTEPDDHGISAATVEIAILARGYGKLEADALAIGYNLTVRLPNMKTAIVKYLAGRPEGTVDMPVSVNALSAGRLRLSSLSVVVDTPPELLAPVPALAIPEDGADMRLLDLGTHIHDDFDRVLAYTLISNSNFSRVFLGFNGTFLTARTQLANWSGTTDVVIEATDSRGQKARTNTFTISVDPVNDAPLIVSFPPNRAELARNFTYQVRAIDAENGTLTFGLDTMPPGMTINETGMITWVPGRASLDVINDVAVNVSDGELSAVQRFQLGVVINNRRPALRAPVPLNETAWTGKPYFCQFRAQDLDTSDRLNFSLDIGPPGMSIEPSTGLVTWASPASGNHTISVNVTDGIDFDVLNYTLRAMTNSPPKFTSTPLKKATVGQRYLYQLGASDADAGAYLTYNLVSRPEGMTVEPGGQLIWTPSASQKGKKHVDISVSDGLDPVTQSFDIQVSGSVETIGSESDPVMLLVAAGITFAAAAAVAGWLIGKRKRQ